MTVFRKPNSLPQLDPTNLLHVPSLTPLFFPLVQPGLVTPEPHSVPDFPLPTSPLNVKRHDVCFNSHSVHRFWNLLAEVDNHADRVGKSVSWVIYSDWLWDFDQDPVWGGLGLVWRSFCLDFGSRSEGVKGIIYIYISYIYNTHTHTHIYIYIVGPSSRSERALLAPLFFASLVSFVGVYVFWVSSVAP